MANAIKGQIVIVRAFQGRALISRVWGIGKNVVYITNDENFEKLRSGRKAAVPIGFPKNDIFKYSPEIAQTLNTNLDWSKLERWNPSEYEH